MNEQPSLTAIVEALDGRREGSSYRVVCPVHNGHSLIVTEKGETILFNCKDGCDQGDFKGAMEALFSEGRIKVVEYGRTSDCRRKIVAVKPEE